MWGDGRLKYIYFTSLHFFAHPTNPVGRVSVRTPSPQGLSVAPSIYLEFVFFSILSKDAET